MLSINNWLDVGNTGRVWGPLSLRALKIPGEMYLVSVKRPREALLRWKVGGLSRACEVGEKLIAFI